MKRIIRICKHLECLRLMLVLALLTLCSNPILSQVSLSIKADSLSYEIGSALECQINLSYDPEVRFVLPDFTAEIAHNSEMEITSSGVWDTLIAENATYLSRAFTLMVFDTGVFEIGPLVLEFTYEGKKDTVISNVLSLEIVPASSEHAGNMAPIKDIVRIPVTPAWVWWIMGGLLVMALLAYWYYKASGKPVEKPELTESEEPVLQPTPWKTAMEALELLKHRIDEEDYFYARLSFIIRNFLAQMSAVAALELSSDEILNSLEAVGLGAHKVVLHELLYSADLAKYAKGQSPETYRMIVLQRAMYFVEYFANAPKNSGT